MTAIYFLIILVATTIGAMAGLGGGVIIKPLFDMIGTYNSTTVGLYSAVAVFSMALLSTCKKIKEHVYIDKKIVLAISFSSIIGGIVGEQTFKYISLMLNNDQLLKGIQAIILMLILILVLLFSLFKKNIATYHVKQLWLLILIGFLLGAISVFLGIGGGPLNIIILTFFFSFNIKETVVYSVAIILFSQGAKIAIFFSTYNLAMFDLKPIPFIILGGLLGGLIGTAVGKRMSIKGVEKVFISVMAFLILISAFNTIIGLKLR